LKERKREWGESSAKAKTIRGKGGGTSCKVKRDAQMEEIGKEKRAGNQAQTVPLGSRGGWNTT